MKKLCLALTLLILALCMMGAAYAETAMDVSDMPETTTASTGDSMDVIMILDYSGSMDDNDPERLMRKAAMNFIDMCDVSGTRVALIPFNYKFHENGRGWADHFGFFRELSNVSYREAIRNSLLNPTLFKYGNDTDPGPAFKMAWELYANRSTGSANPNTIVLFFSDGKVKIRNSTASTEVNASKTAVDEAVEAFKNADVPIYVIGLKRDEDEFDAEWLNGIAERAGTETAVIVNDSTDLHTLFSAIFAEYLGTEPLPLESRDIAVDENGFATISIEIPNNSIMEANIRLSLDDPSATFGEAFHLTRPNGAEVTPLENGTPSRGEVIVGNSEAYYNLKLIQPEHGTWTLTLNTHLASVVSIEVIANYDIDIRFRDLPDPATLSKGDHLRLEAEFYSTTTGAAYAEDEYLYQLDMITQSIATKDGLPMGEFFQVERSDYGTYLFVGDIPALDKGIYEFQIKVDGAGIQAETELFRIELDNNAPIRIGADFEEPIDLSVESMLWRTAEDTMEINLHQYFRDPDGDPLTFIVSGRGEVMSTRVSSAGILQINCEQAGECTLIVKANDGELDSNRNLSITFTVKSCKAQVTRELIIMGGAALLLLILLIIIARKNRGRFIASAAFEASYSKLTFSMTPHSMIYLSRYNDKKVSLYTVLDDASAGMGACHQIDNAEKSVLGGFILKPKRKGSVQLINKSSGGMNVSVSGSALARGKSITLNTGSNVVIEFSEPGRSISLLYRHE